MRETRDARKSKLCEIKAVDVYDVKIALRVLYRREYDLRDSFQERINPESRKLPAGAHNATGCFAREHDNSAVSLRNENPRAPDEMETGRNIECS